MRADALLAKAISLYQQGKHEEAECSYRAVLKKHPENFTALHHLGALAFNQNKLDKAHELITRALALNGTSWEAHNTLGTVLRAQGKRAEAAASYRLASQINPRSAAAHSNLAITLMDQNKNDEAIAVLEKALTIAPRFVEARFNLGVAYEAMGQRNKAIEAYRAAIEINPSLSAPYINLGNLLRDAGHLNESVDVLQKAAKLEANAMVLNSLGSCYHLTGRIKEAEECFREAIRLQPDYVHARTNLGLTVAQQERHEEAVEINRAALRVNPNAALAVSNLFFQQRQLCDWQDFETTENKLRDLVRKGARVSPFAFITANTSPDEQLMCARSWAAYLSPPPQAVTSDLRQPGRIRIGYLSCDFKEHATAFLIAEMLERHDKERFEIFAYSFSVDDGSAMRGRLIAAFDHFIDISAMPHEAVIHKIREDGIDILVDLKGYTQNARTEIMAGRPAPVQVNYLGYPGTMGADWIDYMIADQFVVPADQRQHFSEKLVYLPHCYQPNDTKRAASSLGLTRQQFGLPEDGFVFCSFNGNYKITPTFFDIWMRLLKNTPGSVLWLLETGTRVNLLREAEARGVAPERIVFAKPITHSEHLERMALADLFLDSLPVNAHTTASDALWAGLPVLTCAGKAFVGRVAGSLLHSIGLPELITSSLEEYEAKANHLAQNPPELLALRERLVEKRRSSPVFDIARFTRNLETAFQMMFDRWQAGLTPDTLSVEENSATPQPAALLSRQVEADNRYFPRIRYQACPLCEGRNLFVHKEGDCSHHPLYTPAIPKQIVWLRCQTCGHVFSDGYFGQDACSAIFQKTNPEQQPGFAFEQHRVLSARIVEKVARYQCGGRWLDVGFGNGSLLFTAAEWGYTPVGLDLRPSSVEVMTSLGFECHCQDISTFQAEQLVSVISMANVLEKMPFPIECLKAAHRLLQPNGVLFLSLPAFASPAWRFLDVQNANPYWGELEHYHNFSRERLYELLISSGFETVHYGVSERYRVCMEVIAQRI